MPLWPVLLGPPGELKRGRERGDPTPQERDVGSCDGDVRSRPNCHADIGLRERRRVVDAIADHRDHTTLALQALHLDIDQTAMAMERLALEIRQEHLQQQGHLSRVTLVLIALGTAAALYLAGGVRSMERGIVSGQHGDAPYDGLELVRLTREIAQRRPSEAAYWAAKGRKH